MTAADVREVTADEQRKLAANGWVKLDGFVDPQLAGRLLERARNGTAEDGAGPGYVRAASESYRSPLRDDKLFGGLATSPALGRAAAQLLGCDSSIRLVREVLDTTTKDDSHPLQLHQDAAFLPVDRNAVTFWIALADVEPDQVGLLFYTGSHRFGALGVLDEVTDERCPALRECPVAAPDRLAAGDATAHLSQLVHAPAQNENDRARWGYILSFAPGDARYVDLPTPATSGLTLEPFARLEHPDFPVVYDPDRA